MAREVRGLILAAAWVGAVTIAAVAADPILWNGTEEWDSAGAPHGALLTDNEGWWGRSVFTGVTYSYAEEPTARRDTLKDDASTFGRRLLDGNGPRGWHRPVGVKGARPLVVVFDFKRPCVFAEVDLMSEKSPCATALVEASSDGMKWAAFASAVSEGELLRMRPDTPGRGRFLRVTYRSKDSSATYLDEVLVWGDGEISAKYPEALTPILRGDALRVDQRIGAAIEWIALKDPTDSSDAKNGVPQFVLKCAADAPEEIMMARNEVEVRYFAVANGTASRQTVALCAAGGGDGLNAELCIGGLVRVLPHNRKLTRQQRFDLKLEEGEDDVAGTDQLGIVPFFSAKDVPPGNFARKYMANPEQVSGFPDAVVIEPGECAVVMLRLSTSRAKPDRRRITLSVGSARREVLVRIVDATLPDDSGWVAVWGAFTRQFPFESRTRYVNDARPLRDLGASLLPGLPVKGSKTELAAEGRTQQMYYKMYGVNDRTKIRTYGGKVATLDDDDMAGMRRRIGEIRKMAQSCDVRPDQIVLEISDEPGLRNAEIFGEACRYLKMLAPDMNVYMNPCFWERKRFSAMDDIIAALEPYYAKCVDVSVPYRSLMESEKGRKALWTAQRRINAQYAHPAHRAGRSIAWSSFRYGLSGFGYWAYFGAPGNPWDVRDWPYYAYECQLAFPLENGVALSPIYEEMREAWEDWRLLSLLHRTGRTELLSALLEAFAASFDRKRMESSKPYSCDFRALRDKALAAFRVATPSKCN